MTEFIYKLGGTTSRIDEMLREADNMVQDISEKHLAYDFDGALRGIDELSAHLDEAMDLSVELKDEVLLYIYLIEWTIIPTNLSSMVAMSLFWSSS